MAHVEVVDPGFRTTLQDLGRRGYQRFGVPVSGALDAVAMRAANLVVGNAPDTAVLEIALVGPVFIVAADGVRVAAAGGDIGLEIDGRGTVPGLCTATLSRGERLRVVAPRDTAVGYLAIAGGLAVPRVLGSLSTTLRAGLGGFDGRALRQGDRLPLVLAAPPGGPERAGSAVTLDLARPQRLRVLMGEPGVEFAAEAEALFLSGSYVVTQAADRMGLRLSGPRLEPQRPGEGLSEGPAPGAIQVPGDGQPILLLADRQTTGGYPRIAHVIAADLDAAGRLRPGDVIGFEAVDLAQAAQARRDRAAALSRFAATIAVADPSGAIDIAVLAGSNLVSGVVSGDE